MVDTGQFKILSCKGELQPDGRLMTVYALTVLCNSCTQITDVARGELETVSLGTVITCEHCGKRQAVSNASIIRSPSDLPGAQHAADKRDARARVPGAQMR